MLAMPYSEREQRVVALLEDRVREELRVTDAAYELGLSEETIERLMGGVTAGVLYAFSVDWNPDWVRQGDVHTWEKSGAWFARCGVCLLDSPEAETRDKAAAWARGHQKSH
jgi:hypothetical protein